MDKRKLVEMIDFSLLSPTQTETEVKDALRTARQYGFKTIAMPAIFVRMASKELKGTGIKIVSGPGFPLGISTTTVKVVETIEVLKNGADEVDFMLNLSDVKGGFYERVLAEAKAIADAAEGHTTKMILETCYLTDEEKKTLCEIGIQAGVTFIKTSTGFGPAGATVPDVKLLKSVAAGRVQVKASGGIRSYEQAVELIEAGATRLGISWRSAVGIIDACR